MTNLVIPNGDDNRETIQFYQIACRRCEWESEVTENEIDIYEAQDNHYDETKHPLYWKYGIRRIKLRVFDFRGRS